MNVIFKNGVTIKEQLYYDEEIVKAYVQERKQKLNSFIEAEKNKISDICKELLPSFSDRPKSIDQMFAHYMRFTVVFNNRIHKELKEFRDLFTMEYISEVNKLNDNEAAFILLTAYALTETVIQEITDYSIKELEKLKDVRNNN